MLKIRGGERSSSALASHWQSVVEAKSPAV
jgi:hypothetical protein